MRITKFQLALSLVVVATLGATTALAGDNDNPFNDVPDVGSDGELFYSAPVEWLWDNALTTGSPSGSDTFRPDNNVTRGEYATFNFRYDQNVVQPALSDLGDDVTANTDALNALPTVLSATVAPADAGAAIVQGNGAVSVNQVSTGYFNVVFDRDVTGCTWVASYGPPNNNGVDAAWATVRGGSNTTEARVVLRDNDGAQVDGDGFHLVVVC